jgi:Asp-tRNA(Asn)/Glu-tRNA(Gln) amidotransferase A subunit family amidase
MPADGEATTISDLAPRLRRKEISPIELTRNYLDRTKRLNPLLNAYVTLTEEQALADAARAEREIHRGQYRGPLHGVPFSSKTIWRRAALEPPRVLGSLPIGFPTSMLRRCKG